MKSYYNTKKSAFIIINNPFNTKIRPYAVLGIYNYEGGFP